MNQEMGPITFNSPTVGVKSPSSAFLIAAVRAFHRAERDGAARMHEAFGTIARAEEFPAASRRVRSMCPCSKLWKWAVHRWGNAWTRMEYELRDKPNAASETPPPKI